MDNENKVQSYTLLHTKGRAFYGDVEVSVLLKRVAKFIKTLEEDGGVTVCAIDVQYSEDTGQAGINVYYELV